MSDTETDAADRANKAICERLDAILSELRAMRAEATSASARVDQAVRQLPNIIYRNVRLGG